MCFNVGWGHDVAPYDSNPIEKVVVLYENALQGLAVFDLTEWRIRLQEALTLQGFAYFAGITLRPSEPTLCKYHYFFGS